MHNTPYLTAGGSAELEHQIRQTHPGQAHWAGSGPLDCVCGECAHLGYWRQIRNSHGEVVHTRKASGCAMFHRLTGGHGPAVPASAGACRHFQRKEP
jgi:hypothetical protein